MIRKILTGIAFGFTLSGFALLGWPLHTQPAAAARDCYGERLTCYAQCGDQNKPGWVGCTQSCDGKFNACQAGR